MFTKKLLSAISMHAYAAYYAVSITIVECMFCEASYYFSGSSATPSCFKGVIGQHCSRTIKTSLSGSDSHIFSYSYVLTV